MFVAQVENTHLSLQISFRSLVDDPLQHWPLDRGHHGCSAIWVRLVGKQRAGQRPFFCFGLAYFSTPCNIHKRSSMYYISLKRNDNRPEDLAIRTRWLEVQKDVRKRNRPLFCATWTSGSAFVQAKAYPEVLATQKNTQFRFWTPFHSFSSTSSSLSLSRQLTP